MFLLFIEQELVALLEAAHCCNQGIVGSSHVTYQGEKIIFPVFIFFKFSKSRSAMKRQEDT